MRELNKMKAFTLSEIIVVLILTTIVVGLAFSVLSLVQKQMSAIKNNYSRNLDLQKLETSLWLDFHNYSDIRYDELRNELKLKNELDSITYKFSQDHIVKEEDSFNIALENKMFFFDGEMKKDNRIDAIKLLTTVEFQNKELFIFKTNDATIFMR